MQRLLDAVPLAKRHEHHRAALLARHDDGFVVLHHAVHQAGEVLARFGIGGDVDHRSLLSSIPNIAQNVVQYQLWLFRLVMFRRITWRYSRRSGERGIWVEHPSITRYTIGADAN